MPTTIKTSLNSITIHDKEFVPFINSDEIAKRVSDLAAQVNLDYKDKNPLLIGVLNGCFMFATDLMKALDIPCEVAFIRLSSYEGLESSGTVRQVLGLQENVFGRHLILVEDIVDSGLTMAHAVAFFEERGPKSIEIASMLVNPEGLEKTPDIKYKGFEVPNGFVVGYGLDYDGRGRNLKDIYQLKLP